LSHCLSGPKQLSKIPELCLLSTPTSATSYFFDAFRPGQSRDRCAVREYRAVSGRSKMGNGSLPNSEISSRRSATRYETQMFYAIRDSGVKSLPVQPPLRFRFGDGTEVRRLGYGAMRLTGQPGNFGPYEAWDDGKKVLQHALELGITCDEARRLLSRCCWTLRGLLLAFVLLEKITTANQLISHFGSICSSVGPHGLLFFRVDQRGTFGFSAWL
jgi:hypothetical protein